MQSPLLQSHITGTTHYLAYQGNNKHTILILHGRGGSCESRRTVGEGFSKIGYSVIIPDLPGFGQTPLPHAFTIDDYAHWVKFFLKQFSTLNLQLLTIIGHSNGGRIATYGIANNILHCDHLVLNNSAGIPLPPQSLWRQLLVKRGKKYYQHLHGGATLRKISYKLLGGHDYLQAENNPLLKQTFLNMLGSTYPDTLYQTITTPTLVLRGEHDTYTPLWMGQKMASLLPHQKFVICKNKKHGIHLTDPQCIIDEVHAFLHKE